MPRQWSRFIPNLKIKESREVLKLRSNYGLRDFRIENNHLTYDNYFCKSYYNDELKFLKDIEPFLEEKSTILIVKENYPRKYVIKDGKWHKIVLIRRKNEKGEERQ